MNDAIINIGTIGFDYIIPKIRRVGLINKAIIHYNSREGFSIMIDSEFAEFETREEAVEARNNLIKAISNWYKPKWTFGKIPHEEVGE